MTNGGKKQTGKAVPPTSRFVVSYRRAGKQRDPEKHKTARALFERSFNRILAKNVSLLSHNEEANEEKRGIKFFEADYLEINKLKKELPSDYIVEPLITRKPSVALPFNVALSSSQPLGTGNQLVYYAKYGDKPLSGVSARVNFVSRDYPAGQGNTTSESQETDAEGKVVFEYDGNTWLPVGATFDPKHSYWMPAPLTPPVDGTIHFLPLPMTGPLGWWHHVVGVAQYNPTRGSGIRIGVADTGVGPNRNLQHIKSIGAFIDGKHDTHSDADRDCLGHGSHVCGIIAALPPAHSTDYAGLVPGAEVYAARVFPKDKGLGATQGDIANAIDALATEVGVHLINLSLGSDKPSAIELDAIRLAMEYGTLCVCAAGNENGGPVCFPAAYNETVAVSALGLRGMYPPGTLSFWFTPKSPEKFGINGFFLASYSNIGKEIVCCSPGTGIISTVPETPGYPAPYMAMDGTSMSSPMVTGALAACLARDAHYKTMPGDTKRFAHAVHIAIGASSNSLNLKPIYQGYGLTECYPPA